VGKYENIFDNVNNVFRFCGSDMENSLLDSVFLGHSYKRYIISWNVLLQCGVISVNEFHVCYEDE